MFLSFPLTSFSLPYIFGYGLEWIIRIFPNIGDISLFSSSVGIFIIGSHNFQCCHLLVFQIETHGVLCEERTEYIADSDE
jgi:hypothetical protein